MPVKVHYFPFYGLGEKIRMALHICGVEFENADHVHMSEEWLAFKPTTEFGQMPLLELEDGTQIAQSQPIFNFVCDKWGKEGLVPTDPMVRYQAECTVACLMDDWFTKHFAPAMYMADGEEKIAKFANAVNVEYPKTVVHLERRIPAEGFLCGATISKYDIHFSQMFLNLVRNKNTRFPEHAAALWAATPANV